MTTRAEQLHGGLLVATAATIPIGEGVAYVACAALAVVTAARWRSLRLEPLRSLGARRAGLGLALWLGAGLLALFYGGEAWPPARNLGALAPIALMPVVLLASGSLEKRWLRAAVIAFIVTLTLASLFAIAQYVYNVRPGEGLVRTDALAIAQGRRPGDFQATVAGGFYFHRLKLAHVLIIGIASLVARQVCLALSRRRRGLELALLAPMIVAMVLTHSRTAVAALVIGVAIWATVRAPRRYLLVGAAGLALLVLMPFSSAHLLPSQQTLATRAAIWTQAGRIIADHPLGMGLGQYPKVSDRYLDSVEPGRVPARASAHNLVLATWAEAGPVGLVGFAWVWLGLAALCAHRIRDPRAPPAVRTWAGAGLIALVALWLTGTLHDVLFHQIVALAYWGLAGALLLRLGDGVNRPDPV